MSKGVCPHCHQPVAINLEEQAETCPHCQNNYLTAQANKLYGLLYTQYSSNGNIALNSFRNYQKALNDYEKLLSLDSGNIDAIFGIAHAKICLATLSQDVIDEVSDFLASKKSDLFANIELYSEIARNLLAFGARVDEYLDHVKTLLTREETFIDESSKSRYQTILDSSIVFWNNILDLFKEYLNDYDEEKAYISKRISVLKNEVYSVSNHQISPALGLGYESIASKNIFGSRAGLFKAYMTIIISQFLFVIGAIIGFSIMMANYQSNPFPGLIIFLVFALLFIIGNIIGRVLKKKLSI